MKNVIMILVAIVGIITCLIISLGGYYVLDNYVFNKTNNYPTVELKSDTINLECNDTTIIIPSEIAKKYKHYKIVIK